MFLKMIPRATVKSSCGILGPHKLGQEALYVLRPTDLVPAIDDKVRHALDSSRVRPLDLLVNHLASFAALEPGLGLTPVDARLLGRVEQQGVARNVAAFLKVPPHHARHQLVLVVGRRGGGVVLGPGELDQPVGVARVAQLALHGEADALGPAHARHALADGADLVRAELLRHALQHGDALAGGQRGVEVEGLPGDVEDVRGAAGDGLFVDVDGALEAFLAEVALFGGGGGFLRQLTLVCRFGCGLVLTKGQIGSETMLTSKVVMVECNREKRRIGGYVKLRNGGGLDARVMILMEMKQLGDVVEL